LQPGDLITETFEYTITDADGDSSTELLTVNISGTSDPAPVAPAPESMPFAIEGASVFNEPVLDFSNLDNSTDSGVVSPDQSADQDSPLAISDVLSSESDPLLENSPADTETDIADTDPGSTDTNGDTVTTEDPATPTAPVDPPPEEQQSTGGTGGGLFGDTSAADLQGGGATDPGTELAVYADDGTVIQP
jgi:hypothetical protein